MRGILSSTKCEMAATHGFIERFIEACGSGEAADIQRLLNISYQAARNYLDGRLPDTRVLLQIAARTRYSIHWILTGNGEKFTSPTPDTPILTDQLRDLIRIECREAVNNLLGNRNEPRVVVLEPEKIRSESISPEVTDVENIRERTS